MKTNLDKYFKTDESLETEGVWFAVTDDTQFLVRSFTSAKNVAKIEAARERHFRPFSNQIKMKTLKPEQEQEILYKVFIEACMVDWKGVEIEGVVTPYSPEACLKLFKLLPQLAADIISWSNEKQNYKEVLGNS